MTWLQKNVVKLLAGVALALLFGGLLAMTMCHGATESRSVARQAERSDAAKDQASVERRSDDTTIAQQHQEQSNVIATAPVGQTGPATRALNCNRWMRAHPGAARPAGC